MLKRWETGSSDCNLWNFNQLINWLDEPKIEYEEIYAKFIRDGEHSNW